MRYGAITFDTQIVERLGFRFDTGMLAQLKQFKDGLIDVIVSDVIAQEITAHLTAKVLDAKEALDTATRIGLRKTVKRL